MNIYDTANRLASEIKQSEEYVNYKMAKQALNLNTELKKRMSEFEKVVQEAAEAKKEKKRKATGR